MVCGSKKVREFYSIFPYPSLGFYGKYKIEKFADKILKSSGLKVKDLIGKNVLDLGCGTGEICCSIAFNGANVLAVDFCQNSLERAKFLSKKHKLKTITFLQSDLFELNSKISKKFDLVMLMGVAHHTSAPKKAFEIALSFLKPDGIILLGLYNSISRKKHQEMQSLLKSRTKNFSKKVEIANEIFFNGKASEIEKIYLADKFANPLEKTISLKQALSWFKKSNVKFIGSDPSIDFSRKFEEIEKIWLEQRRSFFILCGKKN